jgi:hypothetical protein
MLTANKKCSRRRGAPPFYGVVKRSQGEKATAEPVSGGYAAGAAVFPIRMP